jgi:multidrug resistance efflux pump
MASEKSPRKIELHSSEVEDMLGRMPGWITRNGSILFLFLLALLLFGSWIFRYPDIRRARIVVTSVNPPADMEARTSGKIVGLFVRDNELVKAGTIIAVIENPAVFEDVMELKKGLAFLDTIHVEDIPDNLPELSNVRLGTLQTSYSIFVKAYRDYGEFRRIDYHRRRIVLLRTEVEKQQAYARSQSERARVQEEGYNLASRAYNRNATLFEQGVVSQSELENSRSQMLVELNKWQEILSLVAETNINIARTEDQIVDLELKQQEERARYINALEEAINNMKASISSWEQNYLLVAPVSGSVTFNRFWSENQNVKAGEKVLTIIPAEAGSIVGKIQLPTEGAGKVKISDQVNIRFDNYPYLEYGMVKGLVSNISEVPEDGFYTVEVDLPSGLRTYYHIEIPFSQNIQGQAEILTDKMRMLERVLNPIRSAVTKQREM